MLFQLLFFIFSSAVAKRFVGGRDIHAVQTKVKVRLYPYILRLEKTYKTKGEFGFYRHLCTCTAIAPYWVLSAANCIPSQPNDFELSVRLSDSPHFGDDVVHIKYYILHPNFVSKTVGHVTVTNDIALLKTETPMWLLNYGRLSSREYHTLFNDRVILLTYKDILWNDLLFFEAPLMNEPMNIREMQLQDCHKLLPSVNPALCVAVMGDEPYTLCDKQRGAPLIHRSGIVGISYLTLPIDCSSYELVSDDVVGVATPLSPFSRWIKAIIKNDSLDSMEYYNVYYDYHYDDQNISVYSDEQYNPNYDGYEGYYENNIHSNYIQGDQSLQSNSTIPTTIANYSSTPDLFV